MESVENSLEYYGSEECVSEIWKIDKVKEMINAIFENHQRFFANGEVEIEEVISYSSDAMKKYFDGKIPEWIKENRQNYIEKVGQIKGSNSLFLTKALLIFINRIKLCEENRLYRVLIPERTAREGMYHSGILAKLRMFTDGFTITIEDKVVGESGTYFCISTEEGWKHYFVNDSKSYVEGKYDLNEEKTDELYNLLGPEIKKEEYTKGINRAFWQCTTYIADTLQEPREIMFYHLNKWILLMDSDSRKVQERKYRLRRIIRPNQVEILKILRGFGDLSVNFQTQEKVM